MLRLFLLLIFLIPCLTAFAQNSWMRVYGGPEYEYFSTICKSNDGGLLSAGSSYSYGALGINGSTAGNIYLVKTDTSGNLIWQKTYDINNLQEGALSVVQVPNGDIFLSGAEYISSSNKNIFVMKLDSSGNKIWTQSYGSVGNDEPGRMVGVDNDVVITGTIFINSNDNDIWLARFGNAGNIVWSQTYAVPNKQDGYGLCKVHDGGFLVSGRHVSLGDTNIAIAMRTNAVGDSIWYKKVPENGYSVNRTVILYGCTEIAGDTSFALTGISPSYYGNLSAVTMDLNGNVTHFYKSSLLADGGYDVKPLADGGFIVVGVYANFGWVGALYRFGPGGLFMWSRRYLGIGGNSYGTYSSTYSVLPANDGGFYVAGSCPIFSGQNSTKSLLFKTNSAGDLNLGSTINVSISGSPTFCSGGSAILSVPDDYDHYQWIWYNTNNQVSWMANSDTSVISVDSSRAYRCMMWNDDGTAAMSSTINITAAALPDTVLTITGSPSYCPPLGNAPHLKVANRLGNSYQWFLDGNIMSGFTSYQLTPQISGNYSLQITNSCTTHTTPPVQINVGGPPVYDLPDTLYLEYYNGASASCDPIVISVNPVNGNTYQWYRNGTPAGSTGVSISTDVDGYYYLNAQNLCGSAWSDTVWVVYDTIHTQLSALTYQGNFHPTATGCANNTVFQFRAPYSGPNALYYWYKNSQLLYSTTSPYLSPGSITSGNDSGYYYCEIYYSYCNGFQMHRTDSAFYMEENSSRIITFPNGGNGLSCSGAPVPMLASQGNATYQWYKDTVLIPGATSQTYTATISGKYYCEITRACGSYPTQEYYIVIGTPASIISSAGAICRSATDTVSVKLENAFYNIYNSHQWRYNGVPITGATSSYYNTKIPGFYDCIFTYNCDTVISNMILLMDYYVPKAITADNFGKICPGGITNLHAAPGFSYQWYKNVNSTDILIQGATDSVFGATDAGYYFAMISNNLCSLKSNYQYLNLQPVPTPNNICAETSPFYCGSTPVLLSANYRYDLSYQWYQNGLPVAGATFQEYMASLPADYQVQLTDSIGCVSLSPPLTTNNQHLNNVTMSGGLFQNVCYGSSINLTVSGTYASYQWYFNGTVIPGAFGNSISTDSAGTYTVVVTDVSGCSGSASSQVIIAVPPQINSVTAIPSSCQGATGEISISFDTSVEVTWTGPSNITPQYQVSNLNNTNLLPGWYYFTYENYGGGCAFTDSIEVPADSGLYVNINEGTGSLCPGKYITAGTQYNQYQWSTGQTSYSIQPQSTGWYVLTATSTVLGCSGTDSTFITVFPNPSVSIQPGDTVALCSGTSVNLDAGSGFSQYAWNFGATTQSITVAGSGTYIVTVTEPVNSCTNKDTVVVTTVATPTVSLTPSGSVNICQGDTLSIIANGSLNNYLWSNGSTSQDILVSNSGIYYVTVTDFTGNCSATDSVEVVVNPIPVITAFAGGSTSFCIGDSVELTISGATGSYQWLRNNIPVAGANGSSFFAKAKGSYKCSIADQYGCTSVSNSIGVSTPCSPPQDPIEKTNIESENDNANIQVFPNPGTGVYDISLSGKISVAEIQITDLTGSIVVNNSYFTFINDSQLHIDISFLKSGVYILRLADDEKRIYRKRIIRL